MKFKVKHDYVFRDYTYKPEPKCFLVEGSDLDLWLKEHDINYEAETIKKPLRVCDVDSSSNSTEQYETLVAIELEIAIEDYEDALLYKLTWC